MLLKHQRLHLFERGILKVWREDEALAVRWDEAHVQEGADREGRTTFTVSIRGGPQIDELGGFNGLSLTTPFATFSYGWPEISHVSLEPSGRHLMIYVWALPTVRLSQRGPKTRHGYYGYEVGSVSVRNPGEEVLATLARFAGSRFRRGPFTLS